MKRSKSFVTGLVIIFIMSCTVSDAAAQKRKFNGYTFENDPESILFAIKQNITEESGSKVDLSIIDQWIGYINKTKEIVKTEEEKNRLLAVCYRYKADGYSILKQNELSLETYNLSLQYNPTDVNTLFNRAALFTNNTGEEDRALEEFEKILRIRPDFGDAEFAIGKIYEKKEEYSKAIEYYNRAIAINGERQDYKDSKSAVYALLHRSENRSEVSEQLLKEYPEDIEAYELQANDYYMKEEYEKAAEIYSHIIDLAPEEPHYYSYRGGCYMGLKKYSEAIADFSRVITLLGNNSGMTYSLRGDVYFLLKEYDKALADYNMGVELAPYSPPAYTRRGDFYINREQYDKAIADYTKAIELYPYPDYFKTRGEIYKKIGKEDEAEDDFNRADSNPTNRVP
jgi:Tetratricopeptide repeat.